MHDIELKTRKDCILTLVFNIKCVENLCNIKAERCGTRGPIRNVLYPYALGLWGRDVYR